MPGIGLNRLSNDNEKKTRPKALAQPGARSDDIAVDQHYMADESVHLGSYIRCDPVLCFVSLSATLCRMHLDRYNVTAVRIRVYVSCLFSESTVIYNTNKISLLCYLKSSVQEQWLEFPFTLFVE